eukprot:6212936-Pleurochrysis_carterae.AAC.2
MTSAKKQDVALCTLYDCFALDWRVHVVVAAMVFLHSTVVCDAVYTYTALPAKQFAVGGTVEAFARFNRVMYYHAAAIVQTITFSCH